MLDKHFGKIIITILVCIIIIFAMMFYNSNQKNQQYLENEIQSLKQQVAKQEANYEQNLLESQKSADIQAKKKLSADKRLLEKQAELDSIQLEKQQQLKQLKETELDKKLDKIESLVTGLEDQRQQDKELRKQHENISKQALSAAYISQGLQMASSFKMYVAEFYMSEGRFPENNKQLGLSDAKSYDSNSVRSIWVTKGGKITIVYKQSSGQDKGAISIIPNDKNNQLQWKCVTRDFKNIQQLIPQCQYSLKL